MRKNVPNKIPNFSGSNLSSVTLLVSGEYSIAMVLDKEIIMVGKKKKDQPTSFISSFVTILALRFLSEAGEVLCTKIF